MRRGGFTIIEVVMAFLLILGVTFLILPVVMNNTKQAVFISEWSETYTELEYIASVIMAQENEEFKTKFKKTSDNRVIGELVLETLKPYLRIKNGIAEDAYNQHYMSGNTVKEGDKYYIDNFYNTEEQKIVGLKWLNKNCHDKYICGFLIYDLNGIIPPNAWGRDIFGVNILRNGIEPMGKDLDSDMLKRDCSKNGSGIYCSYYYLIGGDFD